MNLAKRIRDLRYAKGWGPDELASRAKISRTALYQIERGNTSKPQAGTLRRISRALGVPLEVLLDSTPLLGDQGETGESTVGSTHLGTLVTVDRLPSSERGEELIEKFRLLLASPMADGIARIVEESFRLLPIIPPPVQSETSRYLAAMDAEPTRRPRTPRQTQPSGE
ncbi:helix-turn-helix domain-containing protein [Paludisphaera rhizosphaerae]|uniref:helix-turn-helix domain-containing protein n=1 Tax=Paludisphaera rhizosphaerae TaxID=2711216 RepID=UPI0013EC63F1|nr:helix-turn-helix transcriptional regulator [Paludisphaera rhizosphaerae]